MEAPVGQFVFPPLERVFFGPGSVARLGEELDRRGRKRALVVTGKTLGGSNLLGNVTAALGTRCVGVFNKAAHPFRCMCGVALGLAREGLRAVPADSSFA